MMIDRQNDPEAPFPFAPLHLKLAGELYYLCND
jgi:hypothetical protein